MLLANGLIGAGELLDGLFELLKIDRLDEMLREAAEHLSFANARAPEHLATYHILGQVLIRLGETEHWLVLNQHHIVSDGASLEILAREVSTLSADQALPPLPIQYADFAVWQRQQLTGTVLPYPVPRLPDTFLALIPALVGSYVGVGLRRLIAPVHNEQPRG